MIDEDVVIEDVVIDRNVEIGGPVDKGRVVVDVVVAVTVDESVVVAMMMGGAGAGVGAAGATASVDVAARGVRGYQQLHAVNMSATSRRGKPFIVPAANPATIVGNGTVNGPKNGAKGMV